MKTWGKYGEPWGISGSMVLAEWSEDWFLRGRQMIVANDVWGYGTLIPGAEFAGRIVACVNACAGMADPVEAIAAHRACFDILDRMDRASRGDGADVLDGEFDQVLARARQACARPLALGSAPALSTPTSK